MIGRRKLHFIYAALLSVALAASVVADEGSIITAAQADESYPRHSEGDIERMPNGRLLLAWTQFEGGAEDHTGATIVAQWLSDNGIPEGSTFTLQPNIGDQNVMSVSLLQTQHAKNERDLYHLFLRKNSASDLVPMYRKLLKPDTAERQDAWSEAEAIPVEPGYHVMNNDRVIETKSGRILAPIAYTNDISKNYNGQVVRVYFTDDRGETWRRNRDDVELRDANGNISPAMEPGLIELKDGRLLMIIRTRLDKIYRAFSTDGGEHWSPPEPMSLTSPAAPASIARIPSTGDLLMVWNNVPQGAAANWSQRNPLTSAISKDEGETWSHFHNLATEPGHSYAYTSIFFAGENMLLSYYDHSSKTSFLDLKLHRIPVAHLYTK